MFSSLRNPVAVRFRTLLQFHNHQLRQRRPVPLRAVRGRSTTARLVQFIVAVLVIQNFLITGVMVSNWRKTTAETSETSSDENRNDDSVKARSVERSFASAKVRTEADDHENTVNVFKVNVPVSASPELEEREREFYQKRPTKVNPYLYHIKLSPPDVCRNDTWFIVVVHSHPSNFDRRAAIRQTWGDSIRSGSWPLVNSSSSDALKSSSSSCCRGMQLVFVIGLHKNDSVNAAMEKEFLLYRDIVQGDFYDDYRNMTLKSLLDLKFVAERCPRAEYMLKSDDDMIVNLPYLVDVLAEKRPRRSVMGPLNVGSRAGRSGKWKLTKEEFPFDRFPPYESGSAYVISSDIIGDLFAAAEYVPPIFIDDVYITGILGRIVGMQHVTQPGFAFWTDFAPTPCHLIERKVLTGTKMVPMALIMIWAQLKAPDAAGRCMAQQFIVRPARPNRRPTYV